MPRDKLDSIVDENQDLKEEIEKVMAGLSVYGKNEVCTVDFLERHSGLEDDILNRVLDLCEQEGLIKFGNVNECSDCEVVFVNKCECEIPDKQKWEKVQGVTLLFSFKGWVELRSDIVRQEELTEFESAVVSGIPSFISALESHPPYYLQEIWNEKIQVSEDFFRADVLRLMKTTWTVASEAESRKGRTDLFIWPPGKGDLEVIGEFKIWGSNDYLDIIDQLIGYFTSSQKCGFVFMINNNKSSIKEKYIELIKGAASYKRDSYQARPILPNSGVLHFRSVHEGPCNIDIIVYHFIFNINKT